MTKNVFGDDRVETTLLAEKASKHSNVTLPIFGQNLVFLSSRLVIIVPKKRIILKTQCSTLIKPISLTRAIKKSIMQTISSLDK